MTQEQKDLLLKDLCARLPYGVKCSFGVDDAIYEICGINPTCCGASEIQATHVKSSINGEPNLTPGTSELHFNKWRNFSIAANKKALEELERQARFTTQHLKHKQRILTDLYSKNNEIQ